MCFGSRPIETVTFPQESDVLPNWFVDFLREKTISPKKLEIAQEVVETSNNNNDKPWKSSRIFRGNHQRFRTVLALFHFFIVSFFSFAFLFFLFFLFFFFLFFFSFFFILFFFFFFFFFQSSEQTPKPAKIVEKFQF